MIQCIKDAGGPFTDADEVQAYLHDEELSEKTKNIRMKKEMQFARESSTTRQNPIRSLGFSSLNLAGSEETKPLLNSVQV